MGKLRNILFINPNRYQHPPILPLAIEYLADELRNLSVECSTLDLCFSEKTSNDIIQAVDNNKPEAVFVTVRNIDSVLYPDTEFFLPFIRDSILDIRKATDAPVVIGGAGISADPEGVRDYLGADIAVVGPGEAVLEKLVDKHVLEQARGTVLHARPQEVIRHGRVSAFDASRYERHEGIMGFRTHAGCSSACPYCIEAGKPVAFRPVPDVISELEGLLIRGHSNLHLCDSEFNENPDYCVTLLEEMVQRRLELKWTLYMKTGMFSSRLFELLRASGAYLITLTVDTWRKGPDYWKAVEHMVALAKDNGIRLSIDLLAGFPREDEDTLKQVLEDLDSYNADEVVINTYIRLYKGIAITGEIKKNPSLSRFIIGDDPSMLSPVFYSHVNRERLKELLPDTGCFRIAGAEKIVNYQKSQ